MSSVQTKKQSRFSLFAQGTLPYIKLQTKLGFTSDKYKTKRSKIGHYVADLIFFAFVLLLLYGLSYLLSSQAAGIIKGRDICILLFTIAELFILIYCIGTQCKRLFKPDDLNIIVRYPINPLQRYVGEIVSMFIKVELISVIIFYPSILIYGAGAKILTVTFAFTSLFATIFMPLLPIAMSLLLCIPFIYVTKLLKDKNVLKLVLFIIFFLIIVLAYCAILWFMADWYIHAKTNAEVMRGIKKALDGMDWWWNPAFLSSRIALNWKVGWLHLFNFLASAVFASIGMVLSYLVYRSMTRVDVNARIPSSKEFKYDSRNPYLSTFIKEFKQTIRTPSYAYFFIGVAVCMPVLSLMIMYIVREMGASKVGPEVFYGLCLLVLMIIISLIGSYSANVISREQNQLYFSKIAPISARKYLLSKMLVNFTVAFAGWLLSVIILTIAFIGRNGTQETVITLSWKNIGYLTATSLIYLIGLTFNGVNLNLARPKVNLTGDPDESNVAIQLAIGVVIASIVGMFAMLSTAIYGYGSKWPSIVLLLAMVVYAAINILIFVFTANSKYRKIEVR